MNIYKFRVWCNVENIWVETLSETTPTYCPNNNEHNIDDSKTTIIDKILDIPITDQSGKPRIHQTSRQIGMKTCFVGVGDNAEDPTDVGGGSKIFFDHHVGDSTHDELYIDFNCIENETWVHEGYVIWETARFDTLTLSIVPRIPIWEYSSGTPYNIYGGYLIIPSDGTNGTINITSDISSSIGGLVYMPDNEEGESPTAFWNADWNTVTKEFENIIPAPYGNGRYNIFAYEVNLAVFINKLPLLGSGFERLKTSDVDQLGNGMRLKACVETHIDDNHGDHHWHLSSCITLHREHTV